MGLLSMLGGISPNADGTPNMLQRMSAALHPEEAAAFQEQKKMSQLQALLSQVGGVPQDGSMGPQQPVNSKDFLLKLATITGDASGLANFLAAEEKNNAVLESQSRLRSMLTPPGGIPSQGVPTATAGALSGANPLSVRNNNPGNMRPVGGTQGFQQFGTPEDGMSAMQKDLAYKISGQSPAMAARYGQGYKPTLANVISTWAPPEENDTQAYIDTVSKKTGIGPDDVLTIEDIAVIQPAMIEQEGGPTALQHFGQSQKTAIPQSLQSLYNMAQSDPAEYADDYATALSRFEESQAKAVEPSTDIGKMQRDESRGLVPSGSTQSLMDEKTRQLRKEEAELANTEKAKIKAQNQEEVTRKVADKKIAEARALLKDGGSNVGGLMATTSLMMPGKSTDADELNSVYSTLKSVISLDKLMEMKAASPTGASGFGALSSSELQLLMDSVAALDPELPIETQKANLETIAGILGFGEKELTPEIEALGVTKDDWDAMTPEQKAAF